MATVSQSSKIDKPKKVITKSEAGVIIKRLDGGPVVFIGWQEWALLVKDIKEGRYDAPPEKQKEK